MDLIDKKLYDHGFVIQNIGDWCASYVRPVEGSGDAYAEEVTIEFAGSTLYNLIEAHLLGAGIYFGRRPAVTLKGRELGLFSLKSKKLFIKWRWKIFTMDCKRRVRKRISKVRKALIWWGFDRRNRNGGIGGK